ncbi:MAG: VWA domain-containing protein [Acidimicrobiia bacterium]
MIESTETSETTGLVAILVGFGRELRAVGLPVGPDRVAAYCRALTRLDPTDLGDLYWSGRACLVSRQADLAAYDEVFGRYYLGRGLPPAVGADEGDLRLGRVGGVDVHGAGRGEERGAEGTAAGTVASEIEVLRYKDFADCSPEELEALRRLMTDVHIAAPTRRIRRSEWARKGDRLNLRRALRQAVRLDGTIFPGVWRRRRFRHRDLVLLLDISGSMADYSRALLQFAYSAVRGPGRVEVFCFGTRLTRIRDALEVADADEALARTADLVLDWDGGTRIGESIRQYVRTWARRSRFRGAVVVVCSDGLERGDPRVLAEQMARLGRLSYRVVWVNPLKGDPRYQPLARGMQAALPHIDAMVSGHSLAGLEELAKLLPALD